MNPISFFEQLAEKLFDKKQVFTSASRATDRPVPSRVRPSATAEQFDYNSITCLCGGTYIKDYQQ